MSSIGTTKLTYESFMALPETKKRYEVVDGVMWMPLGPNADHQWIEQQIFVALWRFVLERGLGVVMLAPLDLLVEIDPLRILQPDIMYLSADRTGISQRADLRGVQILEVVPDLVVEILSPSNTGTRFQERIEDYRRIGVLECWLVDPEAGSIEVLRLGPDGVSTETVYETYDTLYSNVLPGFASPLSQIFD